MAAKVLTTPSSDTPTVFDKFLGSAVADALREITIPAATHQVLIRVTDAAGAPMAFKVAHTGTDDVAVGANYLRFVSGEAYTYTTQKGGTTIYVSGDAANPSIEIASSLRAD